MRTADNMNYDRGYEWWLMSEAKKRNPDILLYGLPWVFPGWLHGNEPYSPYYNRTNLVNYIISWLDGAWKVHKLTINYIGIWNERPYDIQYIKMLRSNLDSYGFRHVQIVAPDSADWSFVLDFMRDQQLAQATDIIGIHYPGSYSPALALRTDRPLWSSEDFSCFNDMAGGGCWARVLNEGYVNGFFTAYIAWNLISSYYDALPYSRSGLMTANQPWSGHYHVAPPIWMSAHYTQFTQVGWQYLSNESGSGKLTGNGTYVSLTDGHQLTVVIETINPQDAPCFYPMPHFTVAAVQQADFQLSGNFNHITELHVWKSILDFSGTASQEQATESSLFVKQAPLKVKDGHFHMKLFRNEVYTLTTLDTGTKGLHPTPPQPAAFPLDYFDDFEKYDLCMEPDNLTPQAGSWEVVHSNDSQHRKVICQMVWLAPVDTCRPHAMPQPIAVIGNFGWKEDVRIAVDVQLVAPPVGSSCVFVALRVKHGGCDVVNASGVYLWLSVHKQMAFLTANYNRSVIYITAPIIIMYSRWYHVQLVVKGNCVSAFLDDQPVLNISLPRMPSYNGFAAIGTETFAAAYFDNLHVRAENHKKSSIERQKNTMTQYSVTKNHQLLDMLSSIGTDKKSLPLRENNRKRQDQTFM